MNWPETRWAVSLLVLPWALSGSHAETVAGAGDEGLTPQGFSE